MTFCCNGAIEPVVATIRYCCLLLLFRVVWMDVCFNLLVLLFVFVLFFFSFVLFFIFVISIRALDAFV